MGVCLRFFSVAEGTEHRPEGLCPECVSGQGKSNREDCILKGAGRGHGEDRYKQSSHSHRQSWERKTGLVVLGE